MDGSSLNMVVDNLVDYNSPWSSSSYILGRTKVEFSDLIQMYTYEKERELLTDSVAKLRDKFSNNNGSSLLNYKFAGGMPNCSPNYCHEDWFREKSDSNLHTNKPLLFQQISAPVVQNVIDFIDILSEPHNITNNAFSSYEPFQRLIILEIFIFIVKKFAYKNTNEMLLYAKDKLGASGLSESEYLDLINSVDTKHSVHIIPRRHGKTKLFSIVLAAVIVCLRSIKVAYICHSSKLISATFQDVVESVEIIAQIINCNRLKRRQEPIIVLKIKDKKISTHIKKLEQPSQIEFIILHNALVCMSKKIAQ